MMVMAAALMAVGADAVQQIFSLPWWVQVLPGLNVVGLYLMVRRISRLELMVETMWQSGTWTVEQERKVQR